MSIERQRQEKILVLAVYPTCADLTVPSCTLVIKFIQIFFFFQLYFPRKLLKIKAAYQALGCHCIRLDLLKSWKLLRRNRVQRLC